MWCQECKLYYWIKFKKLYLLINHKQWKIQCKCEYKSKQQLILKSDKRFDKTLIVPFTAKMWCYDYIIVVYVLKVYVKNLSIICRQMFLLFNFNNF